MAYLIIKSTTTQNDILSISHVKIFSNFDRISFCKFIVFSSTVRRKRFPCLKSLPYLSSFSVNRILKYMLRALMCPKYQRPQGFSRGFDQYGIRIYALLKPYVRCWTPISFSFSWSTVPAKFCTCDYTWNLEGKILLHLTFQILICFRFYCFKEISVFSLMKVGVNWE